MDPVAYSHPFYCVRPIVSFSSYCYLTFSTFTLKRSGHNVERFYLFFFFANSIQLFSFSSIIAKIHSIQLLSIVLFSPAVSGIICTVAAHSLVDWTSEKDTVGCK